MQVYNFWKSLVRLHDKAFEFHKENWNWEKYKEYKRNIYPTIHKQVLKIKAPSPKSIKQAPSMKLLLIFWFFIMPVKFDYEYVYII